MNNKKRIYFGLDTASYWLILFLLLAIMMMVLAIIKQKDLFTTFCFGSPLILLIMVEYNVINDKLINRKKEYLYKIIIENNNLKIINKVQENKIISTYNINEINSFLYKITMKDDKKDKEHQIYINNELVTRRTYWGIGKHTETDFATFKILDLAKYIDCFKFEIEEQAEKLIMGAMGYKNEFSKNINKRIEKLRNNKS